MSDTPNQTEAASDAPKKGVCYMSRIPPYMNADHLRKQMTKRFKVGRIYLEAEPEHITNTRKKMGGNRKINYIEGWVEFERKKDAKLAALALNG
jgi:ESF2/ABP1 family protein